MTREDLRGITGGLIFRKQRFKEDDFLKRRLAAILAAVVIIAMAVCFVPQIKIFRVHSGDIENYYEKAAEETDKNVYLLDYTYTTGAGWVVEKTSDSAFENDSVIVSTMFDPRLLKDNGEFELDYTAKLLVIPDRQKRTELEGEKVCVLYAGEAVILKESDEEEDGYYRIKDMSIGGIGKFLMGIVNPRYRVSR